jgi:cytochrome c-type biogenesis protein CcmH/NrfG
MVYFDLENYRKGKEMFENVLKLTPTRTDSLYGLARTLVKLGDRRTAAAKLKTLLKIDKGNSQARKLLNSLEKH